MIPRLDGASGGIAPQSKPDPHIPAACSRMLEFGIDKLNPSFQLGERIERKPKPITWERTDFSAAAFPVSVCAFPGCCALVSSFVPYFLYLYCRCQP
jgi:hypothetical protein